MATSRWSRISHQLLLWSDIPLRLALAATFIAHGYQKLYTGIEPFAGFLGSLGVPAPVFMAWLVTLVEFGGGLLLLFGALTRLAALALAVNMAMAILLVHLPQGFMMHSGSGGQAAGFEWQLALFAMCVALVMRGAGPLSLDALFCKHAASLTKQESPAPATTREGRATRPTGQETFIPPPPPKKTELERPPPNDSWE